MTEHEKYQEHIRHTHDAFCKTVIRHAAIDAARSIRSRRKREISLEYLIEEKHYPFSTTDKYFAEQSGMTSYPLFVCGQMVLLESPELAAALSALSQMEQEIIFLYYFQRLTHRGDWTEIWTGWQHNRAAYSDDFTAATGRVGGLVL